MGIQPYKIIMLTQETLKQILTYDPVSGIFTSNKYSKYCNKNEGDRVGTIHKTKGYRYICVLGKTYREQRLAFLYMTGDWPKGQVDHINRNKEDNSWSNLRDVTPLENCWNRPLYSNNKSGYTGVVWNKKESKWQVLCRSKGVQKYLGLFEDVHEAGRIASEWYSSVR